MAIRDDLEKHKETLLQQRDELQLKVGLAKLEAKEEWGKVEEKVDGLMAKLQIIGEEAADASEDVVESAKHLGEEIKSAYAKIKANL